MRETNPVAPQRPRLPGDPFSRDAVQRRREMVIVGRPFWEDLPGLFAYPVTGGGWIKIALSSCFFALIFLILKNMANFGLGGALLGLILSTGFLGYILNFLLSVTRRTTTHPDDKDPPGWPDFRGFLDQASNFARIFTISIVPILAPVVAYAVASWSVSWSPNPFVMGLVLLPGFFYMPMALLVFAVSDNTFDALNPLLVFGSIFRCGGPYLIAVPFVFLILVLFVLAVIVSGYFPFSSILFYCFGFYFSMVVFRLLGLLYLQCQVRLGWFEDARNA